MSEQRKYKFLFAGNGSYSNRGCEAIEMGTAAILKRQFESPKLVSAYFAGSNEGDMNAERDSAISHVPILPIQKYSRLWFKRQALRLYNPQGSNDVIFSSLSGLVTSCDATLMLGGDNYTLDYGYPHTFFHLNDFMMSRGIPVVLWGASVGPFSKDRFYEKWASHALSKVTLICARESVTFNYLKSIGLEDNVRLVADPAFFLEPTPIELPAEIESILQEGCIGINLSPLLGMNSSRLISAGWYDMATELLNMLAKEMAYPILMVPHVTSPTGAQDRDDYLFMQEVMRRASVPAGRISLLGPNFNAGQTKWVISRTIVFSGARTHATIAALSSAVPTLLLGYSAKARGIAIDMYGHEDWLLEGESLEPRCHLDRLKALLKDGETVRNQLTAVLPVFRERALSAAQQLDLVLQKCHA